MKKSRNAGILILITLIALAIAGGFRLQAGQVYAEGGTVRVNVAHQDGWPEGTEFTFDLYRVGDFSHDDAGKAIFTLDPELAGAGVNETLADASSYEIANSGDQGESDAADYSQKWLETANTLATYINGMGSDKPAAIGERTVTFGSEGSASFSYTVGDNGLYLLVGKAKEVGDTLWTPQPMFISVLNGNKTITFDNSLGVKMISRKIAYEHNVIKNWTGDEAVSEYVRPETIAVKIMYGSTEVDTVWLEKSSDYRYSWKHRVHYASGNDAASSDDDTIESIDYIVTGEDGEEVRKNFVPDEGDAGWSVVEVREDDPLLGYYTTTYTPQEISAETETLLINNTFSCKSLKLIKSIDGYDDDGENVTFAFKIVGKNAAGEEIYINHAGVTFTRDDGLTKEVIVNYIPGAVEEIEVTEEYSGSYELDGAITVTELTENVSDDEDAAGDDTSGASGNSYVTGWEAKASNKHTGHGPKSGLVNVYEHGKDPVQGGKQE